MTTGELSAESRPGGRTGAHGAGKAAGAGGPAYVRSIAANMNVRETWGLPISYMKQMTMAPVSSENGVLTVALHDAKNYPAADELAVLAGCRKAVIVLGSKEEIHSAIHRLYDQDGDQAQRLFRNLGELDAMRDVFSSELSEIEDLLDSDHEAPMVRLVNLMIPQALRQGASDIHIEPFRREIQIRFRIDGVLHEIFSLHRRFHSHLASRCKVMASLDIAEKRLPQDGRMKIRAGNRTVDIRVSIIPMQFGERIVLRILDKGAGLRDLARTGMAPAIQGAFEALIQRSSGIVLVTGPTGSGKTTTLYGALNRINSREKNIVTIEDPVEYELNRVGQIQVNVKAGLTFARGLRSVLRHDPDIVMVGEIRDRETAEIAVQASLTGHLVLSTLHTNDAAGSLTRLVDMGTPPFLIASSLIGVMAQRLVRRICPACRDNRPPAPGGAAAGGGAPRGELQGRGCGNCMQTGYRFRTGLFELLPIDDTIRSLLQTTAAAPEIQAAAVGNGMKTLLDDGLEKVRKGITTLDEVRRVVRGEHDLI